jgi:multidrug efflux pump subunit AcrA (membrane-fusion protein)
MTIFMVELSELRRNLEMGKGKKEKITTKKKMSKNMKIKIMIIALTVAILLLGPAFLHSCGRKSAEFAEDQALSVRTQEVSTQTLRAYLDVNGDIVSTRQADVFPDVAGIIVSIRADLGDIVNAGQVIAEVNPSRPGLVYLNSPVTAPIRGIISRTPLSTGTTVSPNTSITAISTNQNLVINARIPEREIADLVPGLKADVFLQAYPGLSFQATVERVSPVVDSLSRTKLINLVFDSEDDRVSAGMFARLRINTRSYPDVIAVPSEAVARSQGVDVVYVVMQNNEGEPIAERREVNTGTILQGYTEISSGLSLGDIVVVQGQQLLSGGERLRIIGGPRGGS